MDSILDFLNQPFVLTMFTLLLGSFLLDQVAARRSRRERQKDQAIEFLNGVGIHVNNFYPAIYAHLRQGKIKVDDGVEEALGNLFRGHMNVRIGSQAFLQTADFFQKYTRLVDEFGRVVMHMKKYLSTSEEEREGVISQVREVRHKFIRSWPIAGENNKEQIGSDVDEFIYYMDLIISRMDGLLTHYLQKAMG